MKYSQNEFLTFLLIMATLVAVLLLVKAYVLPKEKMSLETELELQTPSTSPEETTEVKQHEEIKSSLTFGGVAENASKVPSNFVSGDNSLEMNPSELLPKHDDAMKFDLQFPSTGGDVNQKNFLTAGYNIGINTVSSSMKNPNLSIRSDPYIPRKEVGPWNQSTILPSDLTNRKTFEIGSS